MFHIVRGTPSDEEIAALTVVLAAAASGSAEAPHQQRDRWSDPATTHRAQLTPGPGAWQTHFWPR